MRFDFNDLKVLEYKCHVDKTWKVEFSTQKNLGTPQL